MYQLSGLRVASANVPLDRYAPGTTTADDSDRGRPDVVLTLSREPAPPHAIHHAIELEGFRVIAFGRAGAAWVLVSDELATFVVSPDGRDVVCHAASGCDERSVASMFVDRVVPHLVDARGQTALHASGAAFGELGAALFLGNPGAGKSTLSAALCPPARYLCDDCAAIEIADRAWVHPSYGFARLNEDAARELGATDDIHTLPTRAHKWRAARNRETERQPLAAMYLLTPGPLAVRPLKRRDAMVELARHLYRIDPTDRTRLLGELDRLDELTRMVAVRELACPRRFDALPQVRALIIDDLGALHRTR